MKKICTLILLSVLVIPKLIAQNQNLSSQTAVPFLLIVPDARSAGMGDLGVATSADAYSNFHNSAKLVFLESKREVSVFFVPWMNNVVKDVFLSGFSYAHKLNERSSFGVNFNYFTLGNVDLTGDDGAYLGQERPSDLNIDFQYALKLSETISMGVGLGYVRSDLGLNSVDSDLQTINTVAVDVGMFYQSKAVRYQGFDLIYRAGLSVDNIGPKVQQSEGGEESYLPTNLKLGAGFDFGFDPQNRLTTNIEITKLLVPTQVETDEGSVQEDWSGNLAYGLGFEYVFDQAFFLRTGYFYENPEYGARNYITFGAGFQTEKLSMDVSYLFNQSQVNNALDNTLRISLGYSFD